MFKGTIYFIKFSQLNGFTTKILNHLANVFEDYCFNKKLIAKISKMSFVCFKIDFS